MTGGRPLLALDTATRRPTLAIASAEGNLLGEKQWESRHRHGEQLLEQVNQLLAETGVARREIGGVVVGTGPGSFTGLRIGLATAKTIAYTLKIPLRGVSTTVALALAASDGQGNSRIAVTLPAGASDRYVHRLLVHEDEIDEIDPPQLVGDRDQFHALVAGYQLVALDFELDTIENVDVQASDRAIARLAAVLSDIGAREIGAGLEDDPADLVPAYVALPRGIAKSVAEMTWSPDLR